MEKAQFDYTITIRSIGIGCKNGCWMKKILLSSFLYKNDNNLLCIS